MPHRYRPVLPADPHASSLLRLPLLRRALADPSIRYVRRGVDARWNYQNHVRVSLAGFNPASGCVFYRANSFVDRWLDNPGSDTREYNPEDKLLPEATFLAHDYLHILGYQWISGLAPELGFGVSPVTSDNYETFVFCHLLTEAVATVGLDYWFLARLDLNRELGIGTDFESLTISYDVAHEPEYQRFCPGFTVQRPEFFEDLASFYCTGVFAGFDRDDMSRSPLLIKWLRHELEYGEQQRKYTREWMTFLSDESVPQPRKGLQAPVRLNQGWQRHLIREIGARLWAVVQLDEDPEDRQPLDPQRVWHSSVRKPHDFRFLNFNRVCRERRWDPTSFAPEDSESFLHWYRQFLCRYSLDLVPVEVRDLRDELFAKQRADICTYLFREIEPLPLSPLEPRDLFMLA